jgi:hypothetical protein
MGQLDKIGDNLAIFDQNFPPRGLPDESAGQPLKPQGLPPPPLFDGHLRSESATTAVLAHPRFAEAGRSAAAGLVALDQGERVISPAMPDRIQG